MQSEFDSQRISRTIALRRGLNRSRAYSLVGAVACFAGAAQCAYLAVQHVRFRGWELRAIALLMLMVLGNAAALWFIHRAAALRREAQQTQLHEPSSRPDFSNLSDGSQRAANLNQIHD